MSATNAPSLILALQQYEIVSGAQAEEIARTTAQSSADDRDLAEELVGRGYLTAFQAEKLLQGRGQDLVIGPYRLLDRVGQGGMGEVFKARHVTMDRIVALKMIPKDRVSNPVAVARFNREVRAVAQVSHPNIVAAFEVNQVGEILFLAMEYVNGIDLARLVLQSGPLAIGTACEFIRQAAHGLQHAHEKGLIHRDIKPGNLIVARPNPDAPPVVKILDFGLARFESESAQAECAMRSDESESETRNSTCLTQQGRIVGTVDYIAPEQADDARNAGTRADIYSLGCSLYYLLTGSPPFPTLRDQPHSVADRSLLTGTPSLPSDDATEEIHAPTVEVAAPIRKHRPEISPALEAICQKAVAKQPKDRYSSALELATDLEHWIANEPVSAWPEPVSVRLVRWARKHKALMFGASATLLVALLSLGAAALVLAAKNEELSQSNDDLVMANDSERRARADAIAKEKETREQLAISQLRYYAAQISRAQREWAAHRAPEAVFHLQNTPPELRSWEYDHLRDLFEKDQVILRGHTGVVVVVAFSIDGKRMASASYDGTVRVWDVLKGRELLVRKGHTGYAMSFSPDGNRLASGSTDGTVLVWDLDKPKEIRLNGHKNQVLAVAFTPDGKRLASASDDRTVRLWDLDTDETLLLDGDAAGATGLAFSRDGKRLACAAGTTVRLWDLDKDEEPRAFSGHTAAVAAVAFSPDGKRLASASWDKTVRLWDIEKKHELLVLQGHTGFVSAVAFSPDGTKVASGSADRTVRLWDLDKPQEARVLKGHASGVVTVSFSPDGKRLGSGSRDSTVRLWELDKPQHPLVLRHANHLNAIAFSPDGKQLASASAEGKVRLWDLEKATEPLVHGQQGNILAVIFSPDGKWLACASDLEVRLWDTEKRDARLLFQGRGGEVRAMVLSRDGMRLACTAGKTVRLWDLDKPQEPRVFAGHTGNVVALAFSPNGKWLVSAAEERTMRLWDLDKPQESRDLIGHTGGVRTVAFSPEGKRLASGSYDSARVWDLDKPGESRVLDTNQPVLAVVFSPDGKRLAGVLYDRTVRLWDADTGHERLVIRGQRGAATAVAFSPDGKRLVVASDDGTVRLWEVENGIETLVLDGHSDAVSAITFSSDGRRLASASRDDTVRVWEAPKQVSEASESGQK